jgi:hypothetical protein
MKFIMCVNGKNHSGPPDAVLMAKIDELAREATKKGEMIFTAGLTPAPGTRIRASGGKLTRVDGPYTETKELIAGFAIMSFGTREEALAAGERFMKVHQDHFGPSWEGLLEIHEVWNNG